MYRSGIHFVYQNKTFEIDINRITWAKIKKWRKLAVYPCTCANRNNFLSILISI